MANVFDPPLLIGFPRPLEPPSCPDFQAQEPPPPLPPARISSFLKGSYWKQHTIEKTQHFIQKLPVYYNFKSSLPFSTFFKTDYSNDRRVFVQRTPPVCFCTTTNVQNKKFVSLEDYVDLRKITAKKVLGAIINKNYNSSFR